MIVSDMSALIPSCAFLVASPNLRRAVFPYGIRRLLCRKNNLFFSSSASLISDQKNNQVKSLRPPTATARSIMAGTANVHPMNNFINSVDRSDKF